LLTLFVRLALAHIFEERQRSSTKPFFPFVIIVLLFICRYFSFIPMRYTHVATNVVHSVNCISRGKTAIFEDETVDIDLVLRQFHRWNQNLTATVLCHGPEHRYRRRTEQCHGGMMKCPVSREKPMLMLLWQLVTPVRRRRQNEIPVSSSIKSVHVGRPRSRSPPSITQ